MEIHFSHNTTNICNQSQNEQILVSTYGDFLDFIVEADLLLVWVECFPMNPPGLDRELDIVRIG